MKNIIYIILVIVICIVASISYAYTTYREQQNDIKKFNNQFSEYINKEFYGNSLATIINIAMDNNVQNKVEKDKIGNYIQNNTNSIRVDIFITDNKTLYQMEIISAGGINKFVQNYSNVKFKCTKQEYHPNGRIKYLYIEQIS